MIQINKQLEADQLRDKNRDASEVPRMLSAQDEYMITSMIESSVAEIKRL